MGAINQFKGLPKQVYLLCFVRIVMALGSFVFAFVSLFFTTVLGFNELQVGYVMICVAAAGVLGSLSGGKLGDTFGRKNVLISAVILSVIAIVIAGFNCDSIVVLPFLLISMYCSNMAAPVMAAMITDYSDVYNRTECFSLMYLCQNIGFATGPTIAGLLFYNHMPWIFFGQGIIYGITVIFVLFLIRDNYSRATKEERRAEKIMRLESKEKAVSTLSILLKTPILLGFLACLVIMTLCYQEVAFILPLQFNSMCGLELGSRYAGYIWTVNGIVCVLGTPIIISLSKKRKQLFNVTIACFLYAIGFGLNGIVHSPLAILALVAIWTVGEILVSTGAGVFIADYSPETHKARFQSLYEVGRSIGRGIGPTLFGMYLLNHSYAQAWGVVSVICIAVAGLVYLLYLSEKKMEQAKEVSHE